MVMRTPSFFVSSCINRPQSGSQSSSTGGTTAQLLRSIGELPSRGSARSAEQRAIAAALSDVDALLGGLDRLIAKKRDLKQAAMQQLLTGQTRLPGFHGEWEVKRLGEIADVKAGTAFGACTAKTATAE